MSKRCKVEELQEIDKAIILFNSKITEHSTLKLDITDIFEEHF